MLTVIIPTYNRNQDLKNCLNSIRNNSVFDIEIIVMHPFNDPETKMICDQFRAHSIIDGSRENGKRKKSLWGIINEGIDMARFDYVCWLNDDCLVTSGWDKISIGYFTGKVGLVVLRTWGICNVPEFRISETRFGIPSANYGILDRRISVRFDDRFKWYQADEDISLQVLCYTESEIASTTENIVIHNHRLDKTRIDNDSDPEIAQDRVLFDKKWRGWTLKEGKVVKKQIIQKFFGEIYRVARKII